MLRAREAARRARKDEPANEATPGPPRLRLRAVDRARDAAIVSVIAVTQLVWMAALAYVASGW